MRLPPRTDARLGFFPGKQGPFFVLVAAPPNTAGMHLLDMVSRSGEMTAMLTHDPGMTWPDRQGIALAEAVIEADGVAVLQFETMADAIACCGRLKREMAEPGR